MALTIEDGRTSGNKNGRRFPGGHLQFFTLLRVV